MSSRSPRLPFTSGVRLFGVLLGASLALGSVACGAAPYGNDDMGTEGATATTKEPSTASANDLPAAEDAGPNELQASKPPVEEAPGLAGGEGAGGGVNTPDQGNGGHPMHNAE